MNAYTHLLRALAASACLASASPALAHDITDKILTDTDADCGSYVGARTSEITDIPTNRRLMGDFTMSATSSTCTFQSNQIPNHDTGEGSHFRNNVEEVDLSLQITRAPQIASQPSSLGMGANAILLNGVKWEAFPAACFDVGREPIGREAIGCFDQDLDHPWRYNIGSDLNDFGFDVYDAHVQPGGLYHYHSTPSVLYDQACAGQAPSPVIGFAADGFPIHGPCFEDENGTVRTAESSFVLQSGQRQDIDRYTTPYRVGNVRSDNYDGQFIGDYAYQPEAGDLDQCNGMVVEGAYGYYLTDAYPYVLACYSGTPSRNFR